MNKRITFATCHSSHIAEQTEVKPAISIEMQGHNPEFGYVWIDDTCYTVYKGSKVIRVKLTVSTIL